MPELRRIARPPVRVMFYVQHLLGIGHLVRAARIATAFAAAGWETVLVMGGGDLPHLDVGGATVVRLPPVRAAEGGFGALVHADGRPFDAGDREARCAELLTHFERVAPDVLITEAFPFGRNQMAFELLPLLGAARSRAKPPLVAASVRDILQANRRPARVADTLERVERFFDLVLVHGDPRLARLQDTFPEAAQFAGKIAYSGLVAPDPPREAHDEGRARHGVVVSAGGGAVGAALLEAALLARPKTALAAQPWLVLTGPNLAEAERERLARIAGPGVRLERFVPDLAGLLRSAVLSISQAGYNTVADVLVAGCRAVLVPYAAAGEQEQTVRGDLLQRLGRAAVATEADLSPDTLADAIGRALAMAEPAALALDLGGAAHTVRIVTERLAASRSARLS